MVNQSERIVRLDNGLALDIGKCAFDAADTESGNREIIGADRQAIDHHASLNRACHAHGAEILRG